MTSKESSDPQPEATASEPGEVQVEVTEAVKPPAPPPARRVDPLAVAALLLVAGLGLGLVTRRLELGWPSFGWSLRSAELAPYPPTFLLLPLLAGLLLGATAWWVTTVDPRPRRGRACAVALLVAGHFGLSITLGWGQGRAAWVGNAVATTWSEVSNGYFGAATKIDDLGAFVRGYAERQATAGGKIGTHPPGAVLAYWLPLQLWQGSDLVQSFSEALLRWWVSGDPNDLYLVLVSFPTVPHLSGTLMSAALWCVLSMAALGSLTVIPVYLLGTRCTSPKMAVLAAALFCAMPNSLFYMLSLDTLLMMFTAWALFAMAAAVSSRRAWLWGLLAGLMLGLALSVSLGALASVVLAVGLGLALVWRDQGQWSRLAQGLAGMLVALVAVLGAWHLAGVAVAEVLRNGLFTHLHGAGGTGHRPYLPWAVWNLVDYFVLAGPPVVLMMLSGLRRDRLVAPAVAAVTVLLLLSASGMVKAETERLWIFVNPLLAVGAAAVAAERASWCATLASQPLWLLLTALTLPPLVRPY